MTEFVISIEDKVPKKQVTITVDGNLLFSANLKVKNEQILDRLTLFFLGCIREDINLQSDLEQVENGTWRK